jgi:hypothetical protein
MKDKKVRKGGFCRSQMVEGSVGGGEFIGDLEMGAAFSSVTTI